MADEAFSARALYLSEEASYAQSPRPADSTYFAVPSSDTLEVSGGRTALETNRYTGLPGKTPRVPGQSSAQGSFGLELLGLAPPGGAGAAPAAVDHLDRILSGVAAGTPEERDGESVTSLAGTDLVLATDAFNAGDVVALEDAAGNVRWAVIATDSGAGAYVLAHAIPNVDGAAFAPIVARATRAWVDQLTAHTSRTYSGIYRLGGGSYVREIPGLRMSSMSLSFRPSQFAQLSFGFEGDDYGPPAELPVFDVATTGDPAVVASETRITGCLWIDGVPYSTADIEIDWQIGTSERKSTCVPSGRTNRLLVDSSPRVTVKTPFMDSWDAMARTMGTVDLLVTSGLTGPSVAVYLPHAQISGPAAAQDDDGFLAQGLSFECVTVGAGARWKVVRS